MKTVDSIIAALSESERTRVEHRMISIGRVFDRCPYIIIPVGFPASGKSTWIKAHLATGRPSVVLSTDDQVEVLAAEQGKTYAEFMRDVDMKKLEAVMHGQLRAGVAERKDIIVDRTNLRVKSRNRWMSQVPKHYVRIGIVFEVPPAILHQRLFARGVATGKVIPRNVIQDMMATYQAPTPDEFDILAHANDEVLSCSTQ